MSAWSTSTGTVAAGASKVSGSSFTTGAVTVPLGHFVVLAVACDNIATTTPTVSGITVPSGETATWTVQVDAAANSGVAGNSVKTFLATIRTTQAWTGFTPVVGLSAAVVAKASAGFCVSGGIGPGYLRGQGAPATGATANAGVLAVTDTPESGDLVVGVAGWSLGNPLVGDTDTLNGSWSAAATGNSGGTDATNVAVLVQSKIVTAAGTQTFNVSNSPATNNVSGALVSLVTGPTENRVARTEGQALVKLPTQAVRVARTEGQALVKLPTQAVRVARTEGQVLVAQQPRTVQVARIEAQVLIRNPVQPVALTGEWSSG